MAPQYGMVFDARPFKPDANDRQRGIASHPLGDNVATRPPWLPTPPGEVGRDGKVSRPLPSGPDVSQTEAMPFAGRHLPKSNDDLPHGKKSLSERVADRPPQSAPHQPSSGSSTGAFQQQQQQFLQLEAPSVDDLFALYRLCGGDAGRVVELLARMWGTQPEAIAPTVNIWLGSLPVQYKPPSRSHTAPPALPSWFMQAGKQAQQRAAFATGGAIALGKAAAKPPPVSAPAVAGKRGVGTSFDMIAMRKAVEKGQSKLGGARADVLALPSMPEHAPLAMSASQWMMPQPDRGGAPAAANGGGYNGAGYNGFPGGKPLLAGPPGARMPMNGGGADADVFLTGGPVSQEDELSAFMYQARQGGNALSISSRMTRGGAHMR